MDAGLKPTWGEDSAGGLQIDGHGIVLQNFHVKDHSENFMIQLMLKDVAAWWGRIQVLRLKGKYDLGMSKPPAMQPWGLTVLQRK